MFDRTKGVVTVLLDYDGTKFIYPSSQNMNSVAPIITVRTY